MIVRSEFRDLDTPTGPMRTHVYTPVRPAGAQRFPGLLLYPEIFQQTAPIARLSVQLASHGYVVMAPEIYHEHEPPGTVLGYDDAGTDKGNAYKHAHEALHLRQRRRGGHPRAGASIPRATVGSARSASASAATSPFAPRCSPTILAAACFYPTDLHTGTLGEGRTRDSLARAGEISGELVMIWGRQDPHIPAEGRAADLPARSTDAGAALHLARVQRASTPSCATKARATTPKPPASPWAGARPLPARTLASAPPTPPAASATRRARRRRAA